MSRFSLKRLLPAAIALLLVAASSVHHCNAQTSELTAALRRVGGQDSHGDGDNLQNAVRSSYRRQLTRAEYEEIKITKGKYDGESLNSDDFKIVFKVGDGIGENIRCLIVRSPEVVVAEMVPCTSPIKLKGRLTVDGMYGVGIFGTTLLTGETIEVTSIWHLDTVPPNTLLTAEPKDTAKTTVEFTFIGFDENEREEHGPLTFQCSLDNEKWKNCTSPRTVSVATPGAHNFRVRARDRAGNADPYPDVYEWEVARTQSSSTNPVSPSPSPSPSAVASPSPSPSPSAVVSPSPSPSPSVVPSPSPSPSPSAVVSPSPSPSPSVVPSPSPSPSVVPSPSPSPSVVPSPSPSPSVVPSPSPSPSPSPVFVPSTSETVTEQNPTVTTLSEEVAPDTVDSTGVSNSGISRGSSSHSDRTVTNEIIAAVVVIPSLVVIIGGIYFLKKQTEERQQMEEEAMADNGIIKTKTVDAPLPDINVEDSERSYSEKSYSQASYSGRSLSERSMPE